MRSYMKAAHIGLLCSPTMNVACFKSQRSGHTNLYLLPLGDCPSDSEGCASVVAPIPVFAEAAEQSGAVWSPAGSQLAFLTNRNGTHSIAVAEVTLLPPCGGSADATASATTAAVAVTHHRILYTPLGGGGGSGGEVGMCSGLSWAPSGLPSCSW